MTMTMMMATRTIALAVATMMGSSINDNSSNNVVYAQSKNSSRDDPLGNLRDANSLGSLQSEEQSFGYKQSNEKATNPGTPSPSSGDNGIGRNRPGNDYGSPFLETDPQTGEPTLRTDPSLGNPVNCACSEG